MSAKIELFKIRMNLLKEGTKVVCQPGLRRQQCILQTKTIFHPCFVIWRQHT